MGKNENVFLSIDRAHEAADLDYAAFDEAVQAKKPAHIARLRNDAAQLTDSLNDYLFDNDNMGKLASALLNPGVDSLLFLANLRELVRKDLDNAAELAAIKEVEEGV